MLALRSSVAEALPHPDLWCNVHTGVASDDLCGWCGRGFCEHCLVRPWGDRRPPYCVACAVEAARLRPGVHRRRIASRRDRRHLELLRADLAALERPVAGPHLVVLPPIADPGREFGDAIAEAA